MYHHPGEYVTDFCIVKRENLYHLFHIRGERWTWPVGYRELDLGHATSTDLRTWTPHEPVLPAGPVGAWDECGNWAPDIIEVDGTYYCYYTGSDTNNNQAIGLATSTDLFQWEKHPANPVVVPGDWSDLALGKDVAGRDAMVFHDRPNERYLLYYTATMADGRACLAVSESTDLVHWHDLGPTYIEEDRSYNRLESAYLVEHAGRFYLFYSAKGGPKSKGSPATAYPHFDIVYQIGETPLGPWQKPVNHELLTEATCASEHPTFDGTTYMLYIIQEEIEGIWGASVLSDPKRIVWQADGTVQVHEHLPETVERQAIFTGETDGFGDWVSHGSVWTASDDGVVTVAADTDTFFMNTLWGSDLA
ncbi:MAG: family 43 glycosylhydrolase [Caldilineaceae bacterium]